ncbi:MAG: hypothetical protein HC820_06215 [Hydrococcus sp. RM1_1_31]|nr:hypothetical protein [Hydrococcus sp. RM1_1_31]
MIQSNNSLPPELQAAIDKNHLIIDGQFLMIPNLQDCPQESLELIGVAFQFLSASAREKVSVLRE